MGKKHSEYARLGFKALKRAANKVADRARKDNCKIPVWKNGQIEFIIPDPVTEQTEPPDANRADDP